MAANFMPFFIVMCEFFNGVLQPQSLMPAVWAYTMYYIGPFTYWITGIVDTILGPVTVQCLDSELVRFEPPPGMTCGEYAAEWLSTATGYLSNPLATASCGYCEYATGTDVSGTPSVRSFCINVTNMIPLQYMTTFSRPFESPWASLGVFALFTFVNYLMVYGLVYVKSVKNWLPW